MSKLGRVLTILIAVFCLPFLQVTPASAKATMTPFSGTEVWFEDVPVGSMRIADGTNLKIRNFQSKFHVTTNDPRVSGVDVVDINANFKLAAPPVLFSGQMWGTFRISNDEGYWQGTWTGVRAENGFSTIDIVGSGGGGYSGLQIRCHIERLTPDSSQPEILNGIILDPGRS